MLSFTQSQQKFMDKMIKYMGYITTCSVFAAFISIIFESYISLKRLNKITNILTGLLAIESSLKGQTNIRPKVAIGYGACTDLLISATEFLNFTQEYIDNIGPEFTVDEVNDERELLQTFAYYFQNGAAAERIMPNAKLFRKLIQIAKTQHRNNIQWFIGGNAPLMGIRFFQEGADVLLGARMSRKLRRLVPDEINIAGEEIDEDDIHIILEYKSGDKWGNLKAPRANRYILHNDQNNPHLNSLEQLDDALKTFQPRLLVISGLQMMDSFKFAKGIRESRLEKVKNQITTQSSETLIHFEMASYVEIELLQQLKHQILPYVDSIGMNEQELDNLCQVLEFDRTTLASDWNPRLATTLDQMRTVFKFMALNYKKHQNDTIKPRRVSRIHVHTLAYQAILTVGKSPWKHAKVAAAKASLTAHRYVCQSDMINPEGSTLILDDSFATSTEKNAPRVKIDPLKPVACWNESFRITQTNHKLTHFEFCVAPVLVCGIAKKTAGAGDNISAAGLSQQL